MFACAAGAVTADRFSQLLAIELAVTNDQLVRGDSVPSAALTVEVDGAICDAAAREIGVTLVQPSSGARQRQLIAVHDVEEQARPRAFALAVAELVRSAREKGDDTVPVTSAEVRSSRPAPLSSPPSTPPPSPEASPTAGSDASVDRDAPRFHGDIEAAGSARLFAPESTALAGASLAAGFSLRPRWLRLRADIDANWSTVTDPLGEIDLALYSAGVALLARSGRLPELAIGPHLQVGYARAVGLASDPSRTGSQEGHVTLLLSLTTEARFWFGRFAGLVDVDLGAALLGAEIYAGDRRAAAILGAFVGVRTGVVLGY
jgi:hypothetical protein